MKQRYHHPFCKVIVLWLLPLICPAQPEAPVHILDIDQGLSQGFVTSIVQGKRGFLWFGTSDGLNKYDGYNFKVYRHDPNDPTSIAYNKINGLTWTEDDRLWIDFYERGLGMYSTEYDQFLHIPLSITNARGPAGAKVHFITRIRENEYLIINQAGPVILRIKDVGIRAHQQFAAKNPFPSRIKVFDYELIPLMPPASNHLIDWSQNVKVVQSVTGLIWINSVRPASLYRFVLHESSRTYTLENVSGDIMPSTFSGRSLVQNILLEDTVRQILYFNHEDQLYALPASTGRIEGPMPNVPESLFYHASLDANGVLWWVYLNALYQYDPMRKEVRSQEFQDEIVKRKLSASRTTTFIDKSGIIWLGTSGHGLLKYRTRDGAFHHLQIPGGGSISVYRILKNLAGEVLVKTWDFRVFNLDEKARVFKENPTIPVPPVGISGITALPSGKKVTAGERNRILQEGHFIIDFEFDFEERFYKLSYPKYKAQLLLTDYSEKYCEVIAEIDSVGSLPFVDTNRTAWIVKMNGDLLAIDLYTRNITTQRLPIELDAGLPLRCSGIEKYSDRRFLLATNYGLLDYDPLVNQGKLFQIGTQTEEAQSIYHILSMCRDPFEKEDVVWLGFEGAGLGVQNLRTGSLKLFTTADGLPNQIINSILPDDQGQLWISTNKGISKLNLTTSVFTNFSSVDGLQSNEFNRGAGVRLQSGQLLFGGVNGANLFMPSDIRESNYNPRVEFTQIQVGQFHVPRFYYANSFNPDPHQVYRVPYKANFITFEFASLDMSAPLKNKYRFRLEGLEEEWSHPTFDRIVSYRYLPPGYYTFRVQGTNSDGVWSDHSAAFSVHIRRPWWLQFWFTAIMSILVVVGIYMIIQFRVRHELRIQDLRNRISADLHDEIGSSLSSISLYSQALLMQNKDEAQKNIIQKIKVNSQLVQEGLNDIVWSIKPGSEDVEDIYHRMLRIGQELMEIKGIHFVFEVDAALRRQPMSFIQKRSLYFIYKEALHNILKYAEANSVQVHIKGKGKQIIMTIQDNGVGFDTGSPMRGNGIYNMTRRAKEIQGTLELSSIEGEGTMITVIV